MKALYYPRNSDENFEGDQGLITPYCTAPLYQQVVDWLREEHKMWLEIKPLGDLDNWLHTVIPEDGNFRIHKDFSKSYYEALNKAIGEVIKLIKTI